MGVFIVDKKWRQRGTGIKISDPRQDCYFDPANEGLVEVHHKQVIERLLAHPHDFEVAWGKHGISFDESGKTIQSNTSNDAVSIPIVTAETLPLLKTRGRPKKVN